MKITDTAGKDEKAIYDEVVKAFDELTDDAAEIGKVTGVIEEAKKTDRRMRRYRQHSKKRH